MVKAIFKKRSEAISHAARLYLSLIKDGNRKTVKVGLEGKEISTLVYSCEKVLGCYSKEAQLNLYINNVELITGRQVSNFINDTKKEIIRIAQEIAYINQDIVEYDCVSQGDWIE